MFSSETSIISASTVCVLSETPLAVSTRPSRVGARGISCQLNMPLKTWRPQPYSLVPVKTQAVVSLCCAALHVCLPGCLHAGRDGTLHDMLCAARQGNRRVSDSLTWDQRLVMLQVRFHHYCLQNMPHQAQLLRLCVAVHVCVALMDVGSL